MTIYLDFNATTPVLPEVLDVMISVYRENYGNAASRTHVYGQNAKKIVDQTRHIVADMLGIETHEMVFTSGATESNNIALLGLAKWGSANGRRHIISTAIEHNAVLEPLKYLSEQGFEIELVSPDASGRIDANEVLRRVRPDTLLVSVMHANNETGIIQPVHEIGQALAGTDTCFHVDAAQTFGKLVDELKGLQYDFLSCTAHKIYGPQGVGALVYRTGPHRSKLQPITFGGGQERGLRPGTVPVALVAGFGKAVELAGLHYETRYQQAKATKAKVLEQLQQIEHTINGDQEHCLPNCISVGFEGVDSEALMHTLKEDIAISNGSACTSSEYKASHVLIAMGVEEADRVVRLSWGPQTTDVDLQPLIEAAKRLQW